MYDLERTNINDYCSDNVILLKNLALLCDICLFLSIDEKKNIVIKLILESIIFYGSRKEKNKEVIA